MKTLLLLSLSMALLSCGDKSKKSKAPPPQTDLFTVLLKGDPEQLIEGATLNKQSPITLENYKEFNDYTLGGIVQFASREVIKNEDIDRPIEEGNEAPTEADKTPELPSYTFKQSAHGALYTSGGLIDLAFKSMGKSVVLSELGLGGSFFKAETLHYSITPSKSAFSVLLKIQDADDKWVLALYFVKKAEKALDAVIIDEKYNYIKGPGVVTKWPDSKLEFNICESSRHRYSDEILPALEAWNAPLKDRLKVTFKKLTEFPPFSDVNVHCLYTAFNYLTSADTTAFNPGVTYNIIDGMNWTMVDSDVFLWVKEIERGVKSQELREFSYKITLMHEFGHVLGLDHQFDGTDSIMSYGDSSYKIWDYDIKAINGLYPKS
jgi:Matrixin